MVSFDAAVSTFTPEAFPISGSRVLLSPYWGDVDTRPDPDGGFVYYRNTTDSTLLTKAMNQVRTLFPAFANFTPTFLFIATWDHVGYFRQHTDKVSVIILKRDKLVIYATNSCGTFSESIMCMWYVALSLFI